MLVAYKLTSSSKNIGQVDISGQFPNSGTHIALIRINLQFLVITQFWVNSKTNSKIYFLFT